MTSTVCPSNRATSSLPSSRPPMSGARYGTVRPRVARATPTPSGGCGREVAVELVGVGAPDRRAVFVEPLAERDLFRAAASWETSSPCHESADLVWGEHDVADDDAECARCRGHDRADGRGGSVSERRRRRGPGRRDRETASSRARRRRSPRLARAGRPRCRSGRGHRRAPAARGSAPSPGSANTGIRRRIQAMLLARMSCVAAEDPGWPDDRVGHAGLGQRVLDERLAPEVRERATRSRGW